MLSRCLVVLLLLCAACSSPQKSSKITSSVRISMSSDPNSLDPRKARDMISQNIVRMFFEGLTRVGKTEKAELALAESFTVSPDLKTYTFHLKQAKWSNGDPVTAQDFVYAWKTLLHPEFLSDMAFYFYDIKNAKAARWGNVDSSQIGVRALNETTLEVELENPVPYFLELTSLPAFSPVNARIDQINPRWADSPSSFVCNGPFCLKAWNQNDAILAYKNPAYWDASSVHLSEVELVKLSEDTEFKMFEKNELDWAGSPLSRLSLESIASLKKEKRLNIKEFLNTRFIKVNTDAAHLNDVKIRQALAFALNRQEIIDHVLQGNQIPASGLVPLSFGLQDMPYFQDGNVIEARRLFNEALEGRSLPEIKLLYVMNERNHIIVQVLQQQWYKALGIQVKLEACEFQVFINRIRKQDFQLAYSDWVADFNDPINFLDVFRYKKGTFNDTQWENAEYAALLERSESEADPQKRLQLLKESEKILIEHMPILPLFYSTMLYVQQPRLKDVVVSSLGVLDLKWANVQ